MTDFPMSEPAEQLEVHMPLSGEETRARRVTFPGTPLLNGGEIGWIVDQSRAFRGTDQTWSFETPLGTPKGDLWVMHQGPSKPAEIDYVDAARFARVFFRIARGPESEPDPAQKRPAVSQGQLHDFGDIHTFFGRLRHELQPEVIDPTHLEAELNPLDITVVTDGEQSNARGGRVVAHARGLEGNLHVFETAETDVLAALNLQGTKYARGFLFYSDGNVLETDWDPNGNPSRSWLDPAGVHSLKQTVKSLKRGTSES